MPGVGAQGGDLNAIATAGMNDDVGLLINSSRGIIYAGNDEVDFQNGIRKAAEKVQLQMANLLQERGLV